MVIAVLPCRTASVRTQRPRHACLTLAVSRIAQEVPAQVTQEVPNSSQEVDKKSHAPNLRPLLVTSSRSQFASDAKQEVSANKGTRPGHIRPVPRVVRVRAAPAVSSGWTGCAPDPGARPTRTVLGRLACFCCRTGSRRQSPRGPAAQTAATRFVTARMRMNCPFVNSCRNIRAQTGGGRWDDSVS